MSKIYAVFLIVSMLLSAQVTRGQTISLTGSPGAFCAGQPISISFTTAGTFAAGNSFRVQLINASSKTYTDLPGTFASSPASVTLPATMDPSIYHQLRVVASSPSVASEIDYNYSFYARVLPRAEITGYRLDYSAVGDVANPYEGGQLLLNLTGSTPYSLTFSDGTSQESVYNTSYLTVNPARTTTYQITSIRNVCGTGVASGSAVAVVNTTGFRLLTPETTFCLGNSIPIYYSTTAPLPTGTTFAAELIDTRNGNRSVSLPISGTDSPLQLQLPDGLAMGEGYQLRVSSQSAGVSALLSNVKISQPPRLSVSASANAVKAGQTVSVQLSYTTAGSNTIYFDGGQTLYSYGGSSRPTTGSTNFTDRPTATTNYTVATITGDCSAKAIWVSRSARVTVAAGVRIDSVSRLESCVGEPITLYFTAPPAAKLPSQLSVLYNWDNGGAAIFTGTITRPGQLTFTPPASLTPIRASSIQLRGTPDTLAVIPLEGPFLLKNKPYASLSSGSIALSEPSRAMQLEVPVLLGGGATELTLNTGQSFRLVSGYSNYLINQWLPAISVLSSQTFSIASVRNECGAGTVSPSTYRVTVPVSGSLLPGINLNWGNATSSLCPGAEVVINTATTGTFGANNIFSLEVSNADGTFSGTPVQTIPTLANSVKLSMPNRAGSFRIRLASSNPVTRSNELYGYVNDVKPSATVYLYNARSTTITAGELINVVYSLSGNAMPFTYELADGSRGIADPNSTVTRQYRPERSTTYAVRRLTDGCGQTTVPTAVQTVTVVPQVLVSNMPSGQQVCAETPVTIPFTLYGALTGQISYVVQIADPSGAYKDVPTSGTSSPLSVTVPAAMAGRSLSYRITARTAETTVLGTPATLTVNSLPQVTFSGPSSQTLLETDASYFASAYLTAIRGFNVTAYLSDGQRMYEGSVSLRNVGTYTVKAVYNECGYGQSLGSIRVVRRLKMDQLYSASAAMCQNSQQRIIYAISGDADPDTRFRFALVEQSYSAAPVSTFVGETTALSGELTITVPATLKEGVYVVRVTPSSTTAAIGTSSAFRVQTPIAAALVSGVGAVYSGDYTSVVLNTSSGLPFSVTLSNGQVNTVNYSTESISIRPTTSGSYSVVQAQNGCGNQTISGAYSLSVLPATAVTVRPYSVYGSYCTGQQITAIYETTGTFETGNTFTLLMSDSTGRSFLPIGTASGPRQLTAIIPAGTPPGNGYLFRIAASNPAHLGSTFRPVTISLSPTGTLTGNTSILKGDSTRLSVALTGTAPWRLVIADFFGPRTFTATASPFTLTVRPDTTSGYRLTEVRNNACGVGTAFGTALITVSRLLAVEPALRLQVRAYPNPTSGWLQVDGELPGQEKVSFEVHTMSGRLVQRSVGGVRQGKLDHRIDLSAQPAGGYVLTAEQAGRRSQFKIVKQ